MILRTNVRRLAVAMFLIVAMTHTGSAQERTEIDHAIEILEQLRQGNFEAVAAEFNAQVAAALSADQLGEVWASLRTQVGEFQSVTDQQAAPVQGLVAVTLTCAFERAALNMIVAFDGENKIAGLRFVPAPAPVQASVPTSDRFTEEPFIVGGGEWALPGTLSLPVATGRLVAVVLVHGSGPNDRDETVGANKPFRDLAWGLADRGIAVLRYEKRTRQHGAKFASLGDFTVREETVEDALLAVAGLRAHDRIDENHIFELGHSLGGTLAPRIAMGDEDIAGLVVMAGSTRPLPELFLEQMEYLESVGSAPASTEESLEALKQQAERVMDPDLPPDTPASELLFGVPAAYWKDLNGYEPTLVAAGLDVPMLILQGERDYQVTLKDLEGWRDALSGRSDVTIKSYPRLNHLFMAGEGKSTPSEYQQPGRIPNTVLDDIAVWLNRIAS